MPCRGIFPLQRSFIQRPETQPISDDNSPPHKWESKCRSCSIINTKVKKKTSHLRNIYTDVISEIVGGLAMPSSYVKFVMYMLRKV